MNKIPCIMLVDDDETTNYVNTLILKKSNRVEEILVATNGKDALEIIQKRFDLDESKSTAVSPMLVFLDINMPSMDGLEFMERFYGLEQRIKEKITVYVLTTSSHPSDLEKMEQFGAHGFINKPLKREELDKFIALHLPAFGI